MLETSVSNFPIRVGTQLQEAQIFSTSALNDVERVMKRFTIPMVAEQPFIVVQVERSPKIRRPGRITSGHHVGELETPMNLKELPTVLEGVAVDKGQLVQVELANSCGTLVGMESRGNNDANVTALAQ